MAGGALKPKVIRDCIHGDIEVSGLELALLDTPEMQRLRNIKQLGMAQLVYPAAMHNRFQHSLGTMYLAGRLAIQLGLDEHSTRDIRLAALLHDIGHLPFSHTLELVLNEHSASDHALVGKDIILTRLSSLLKDNGVKPKAIADTVLGKGPYGNVLSSGVDIDKMDYLVRDAYFTGVAYGVSDLQRLMTVSRLVDGQFMFHKKGLRALESTILARFMMFAAVYDHPTKRIAEQMLLHGLHAMGRRALNVKKLISMDEIDFMSLLRQQTGYVKDMVNRIEMRRLFKRGAEIPRVALTPEQTERALDIRNNVSKKMGIENDMADRLGIRRGYLLLDVMPEPKGLENIKVLDGKRVIDLRDISAFSRSLLRQRWDDWRVSLYCLKEHRKLVSEKGEKLLLQRL